MTEDPKPRTLLVDDEEDYRRALSKRLTRRGLDVFDAGGGQEALRFLTDNQVHVVVLDVKMPNMDGLTALRAIKDAHPEVEVILLTGQASAQDGVAGIMSGAFDYLIKPVEIEHLLGKIHQAYDRIMWKEEQARAKDYQDKIEQRMDAAERLASLGTMAAGIAHEINNPLAIISESAGWLKGRMNKEAELPEEFRDRVGLALGKIEGAVDRARRITHQLLGFARKTDWTHEEFDLAILAEEVVDFTRKAALTAEAEVILERPPGPVILFSDPYQIRQVIINLVTNAIQAVDNGGKVKITINQPNGEIKITVQDNGPGIPKENLDKIFEPFFSTKAPGQGTGLGLSVSRNIMDKLGGQISVVSRIGEGTVFTIALPAKRLEIYSAKNKVDKTGS